jgi:hypothetical protein
MSGIRIKRTLVCASLLLAGGAIVPVCAQEAVAVTTQAAGAARVGIFAPVNPDSTLFTTYSFYNTYTNISWVVCGSTKQSEGCYASGNLGPYGHAGAVIEGNEVFDVLVGSNMSFNPQTNTATRKIFVVDDADGDGTGVKLYVYTKTDVVSASFDTVNVTLTNTVSLPLIGGVNTKTFMAADNNFLFIGTSRGQTALRIDKTSLAMTQVGGFSGPEPIYLSSITADKYGYVAVSFGGLGLYSGFYVFDPNGNGSEDGGGSNFVAGTQNGITTTNLSSAAGIPNLASRMKVHFTTPAQKKAAGN